jgi:hypothetical protein
MCCSSEVPLVPPKRNNNLVVGVGKSRNQVLQQLPLCSHPARLLARKAASTVDGFCVLELTSTAMTSLNFSRICHECFFNLLFIIQGFQSRIAMLATCSISVDFESFTSCCDTFSRLLWSSQSSDEVLSHIQCVSISPPAEFLSKCIQPLLVRLSQFCEPSQMAISLALAAEMVVLASCNSLETAHHRTFLFGSSCALHLRASESVSYGSRSPGIFRKRRMQESMAVISEILIALNLAPLRFNAQVGINDVSKQDLILKHIFFLKSESSSANLLLPLEAYAETFSSFRQQVQCALSGDSRPSPLVFYHNDDVDILDLEETGKVFEMEVSSCGREPMSQHNEALCTQQSSLQHAPCHTFASDFRAISATVIHKIVERVAFRFGTSPSHDLKTTRGTPRQVLEPVCSRLLQTVVFEASKKYLKYLESSMPILSVAESNFDASYDLASSDGSQDQVEDQPSQSIPIFGRHPSYRTPVQQVEVISFEQVNPVWVHQCKPGSRICVLLRCHQRFPIGGV